MVWVCGVFLDGLTGGVVCDYGIEELPKRIYGVLRVGFTQVAAWVAAVVKASVGCFWAQFNAVIGHFYVRVSVNR